MKLEGRLPFRVAVLGLLLAIHPAMATTQDQLYQQYCSTENTGSSYSPAYSIYNSMGKCFDTCKASYAFAVVQNMNCWCSNYVPASQESTNSCNQACPGFPGDLCGNESANLYGYIPLFKSPSGTAGAVASTPSPSSSPPQTTSYTPPPPDTVSKTVTQTVTKEKTKRPSVVTSYVTPTPSTSSMPISSSLTSSSSESYTSPSTNSSPTQTLRVTTLSGAITTQTVTQSPNPVVVTPGNASDSVQLHRKGLSGGAIAGIVLGTLIGLAALALAAFLLWRRRKSTDAEVAVAGVGAAAKRPKRNTSVLSRTGLLARARPPSMSEQAYEEPVYASTGANSVRHSMMFGAGAAVEGVSPVSPLGTSQENVSNHRHSKPLVYDQRLNPSALFANPEANGSRVSMQDQQDYSRPLGITNPDWRSSFDSR